MLHHNGWHTVRNGTPSAGSTFPAHAALGGPHGSSRISRRDRIMASSLFPCACRRRRGGIENLPVRRPGNAVAKIVAGALLGITQDLVRLGKLDELLAIPGFLIVRMVSERKHSIHPGNG